MPDDITQPQTAVSTDQNQITPEVADQNQAAPSGTPQTQAVTTPVQPQAQTVTTPTQPDARDMHPDVQRAHIIRRIGEVLAGGKREKVTYNPDGSVSREPVALTSKEVLTSALANVLSSVGQVSSNLSARMAGRPANPIAPLPSQVAAAQQAQTSESDWNRQQVEKIRKAKIIEANLTAMKAAYAIGKEDDDAKDSVISNHKDDLQRYQDAGIVEASKIPSDQLMQRGFDRTKVTVVPDGRVPAFKSDGTRATNSDGVPLSQITYSVIDSTTQTALTPENYELYKKWGLVRPSPNFKLPESATISTAAQSIMKHKIDLLGQMQREIDEVAGSGKVDLAARVRENPGLLKDVENFHNDAASQDPATQLQNVRAKHPSSAGAILDLMGGQSALDAYAAKNQQAPDKMSLEDAKQILSDPRTDPTSNAAKTARGVLQLDRTQAAQKAAAETTARANAEAAATPGASGLTVPKGFTPNPNASELSSDDLKTDLTKKEVKIPSNYDALYAVAHNAADLKTLPNNPRKGSNQMSAQEGLAFIRQYINPQYQEGDYAAASGLSKELASTRQGTAGGSLLSAGVASNHLDLLASAGDALKNDDVQALNRVANKLGVAVGKSPAVTFSAIADQVNAEVGKVVAGGTPHEAELAKLAQNLNTDQSPAQIDKVIRAYVNLMSGRVNEVNERSQQYFGRDVKGISPETAKVFAKYGVAVPGYVQVKVNGQPGVIPKSKLADFKKQYPNAEVQQ